MDRRGQGAGEQVVPADKAMPGRAEQAVASGICKGGCAGFDERRRGSRGWRNAGTTSVVVRQ